MGLGHTRTDVIRIRRNAPRMWKGEDVVSGAGAFYSDLAGEAERRTRSLRAVVPALRSAFAPKTEPFFWVSN